MIVSKAPKIVSVAYRKGFGKIDWSKPVRFPPKKQPKGPKEIK